MLSDHAFARLRGVPRLNIEQIHGLNAAFQEIIFGQMASSQGYKDALALEAGKVTPGVDDGPYIQYALDALTGRRDAGDESHHISSSSSGTNPIHRFVPDLGLNYYTPPQAYPPPPVQPESARLRDPVLPPETRRHRPLAAFDPHTPSQNSSLATLVQTPKKPSFPKDSWMLLEYDRLPRSHRLHSRRPDFKPRILRPASMFSLMILCALMITALMFCAIYSQLRSGIVPYSGSIYGGQYFLFRILPQLLAVAIHLYIHSVIVAVFRVLPFSRMVHQAPEERFGAIFQDLYPKSYLWPQLIGTWHVWVPCLVAWVANLALPLQSSLFAVVRVDGVWRWAAVQGVVWTLVVLYFAILASVGILHLYWRDRMTGLIWDPRSIADIIALASNSNITDDYRGTELLTTRAELRAALHRREVDQIGYWAWRDLRDHRVWHGLGTDAEDDAWLDRNVPRPDPKPTQRLREKDFDVDVENAPTSQSTRYGYLPWCLRNNQLIFFNVAALVLLVALLVVSFHPSTNIRRGFPPKVSSRPGPGAFSSANFLYSFVPSLLGQILWLLFQSLEQSVRVLQPWAELQLAPSREPQGGARPDPSILADYAACLPLQSAWHAFRNGHYRLAVLSTLATLFILLPALSGGLFMALTVGPGEVRMLPNVPLYAVVLTLLVLYFLALVALLPGRRRFRLSHDVTCIAEIVSFCANDELMGDDTFKGVMYKTTLRGKIGVDRVPGAQPRWILGFELHSSSDPRLGIRRVKRFTELEKRVSRRRRREQATAPMV